MTKNMIIGWLERNDAAMEKAAGELATGIIEVFIGEVKDLKDDKMLQNATDLQECDGYDIEMFYSLLQKRSELSYDYSYVYGNKDSEPYSIKQWNKKEIGYGGVRFIFESWCEEVYEEVLPEDLLKAVRERHDVACIVNSQAYGGGGYEVMQDLYIAAREKVAEIIKQQLKKG